MVRLQRQLEAYVPALHEAIYQASVLQGRLNRLRQRLDTASATEPDLRERRVAERVRERSDELVSRRRRGEHERRVRHIEEEYFTLLSTHRALLAQIASLEDTLERLRRMAAARARRYYEHAWRRVAVYWQRLVLSHRHGAELNAQLRPVGPDLPAWAVEEPIGDDAFTGQATESVGPADAGSATGSGSPDTGMSEGRPTAADGSATETEPAFMQADPAAPRTRRGGDDELATHDGREDDGPDEAVVG